MRLVVARIGRAHGLRGEVSVEVRTDAPDQRFVKGAVLHVEDGSLSRSLTPVDVPTTLTLARVRDNNGTLLLTFEEVGDRTTAEALRNARLEVEVAEASDEPDAWYDHELVGLTAVDRQGEKLGEVVSVQHPGAQDLLVIRTLHSGDRLVPFVGAIVPEVDVAGGRIVLDPPAGLLEDPEE
ncbi:ribosome maturation factor RimM [Kineosporia rhizophila]|uniref:ribosome maturation factor RimM n=1 Tax=Kineosporia TaxID=49184 RepID=UPI000A482973|nr:MULTISPECIES: ribosome maturation factor RimM [Kineosporia]MCE0538964.1 ribosome maturation factor RimM [Kineosporia rhizophila]GLY16174.1 ribosome maturation factor RimM [Kineosporia sp. NBRC 101677]